VTESCPVSCAVFRAPSLIKENSKSVLEQWVNQFSDELYSWAF
jgi:hypothetical protein